MWFWWKTGDRSGLAVGPFTLLLIGVGLVVMAVTSVVVVGASLVVAGALTAVYPRWRRVHPDNLSALGTILAVAAIIAFFLTLHLWLLLVGIPVAGGLWLLAGYSRPA